MKITAGNDRMFTSARSVFAATLMSIVLTVQGYPQTTLKGPQGPPPKQSSITTDHPPNEGWIGRAGGILYTVTNITLANTTAVYWAMLADSIRLSMDGGVYDASEVLGFDAAASDLAGGIAVWTGTTSIPTEGGSPVPLLSKFTVNVVDVSDNPMPLTDAAGLGLPANTGGVVLITGNTMVFKARVEMFVSDNGGTTFVPHLDYYDAAPTPPEAISAYSTYATGFYWENDPPELENMSTLNVNEGDTALITSAILKAVDVESTPSEILFVVDPIKAGLSPQNGKLMKSDTDLAPGDTFTMVDIENELIAFVHNGSETLKDTIPYMVVDGDGGKYRSGEDSIFNLPVNVTPLDDSPTVSVNAGMTVNEGETLALSDAMLLTTDPESSSSVVTYTFDPAGNSDFPVHGLLKLNDIPMSDGTTFTQADIHNGNLVYQHDGMETVLDGFVFQVADEFGHLAKADENTEFFFEIRITPVNDLPELTKNAVLEVNQGEEVMITNLFLAASDVESGPGEITFTLDPDANVDQPVAGTVKLNGTALADGQSFTMADINNSLVTYDHDGSTTTADFVPFSVSDGDGGVASDAGFTIFHFNITVVLANALPDKTAGRSLFTLSPNPVRDQITVTFNNEAAGEVNMILFNSAGEMIWEKRQESGKEYRILFSDYAAGIYYLKATRNKEVQTEKFIKR